MEDLTQGWTRLIFKKEQGMPPHSPSTLVVHLCTILVLLNPKPVPIQNQFYVIILNISKWAYIYLILFIFAKNLDKYLLNIIWNCFSFS